jgi:hypothetical protein
VQGATGATAHRARRKCTERCFIMMLGSGCARRGLRKVAQSLLLRVVFSVTGVHRRDSAPHSPTRSAAAPYSLMQRGTRPEVGTGARRAALQRVPGGSHHRCAQFAAAPPHARRAGELIHLYLVRDHKVRPDGASGWAPKVRT